MAPAILDVMGAAAATGGNPASLHGLGRAARRQVDRAVEQLQDALGARAATIVWTASDEEAHALGLRALCERPLMQSEAAASFRPSPWAMHTEQATSANALCIVVLGHVGTMAPWLRAWEKAVPGRQVRVVSDVKGFSAIENLRIDVLAMSMADGRGRVADAAAAAAWAKAHQARFYCDASALGLRLAVNFDALEADALTLCGATIGGPFGISALVCRREVGAWLRPLWGGGGQQGGVRPGTEPVPLIAAMGAAAAAAVATDWQQIGRLRDSLAATLATLAGVEVLPRLGAWLPHVLEVRINGHTAAACVAALDRLGLAVGASEGEAGEQGEGAVRISLGWNTTAADLRSAAAKVARLAQGDWETA